MQRKYRLPLLLAILIALALAAGRWMPERRFDSIVIHHSASEKDNYQSIRKAHKNGHGWSEAAYHLILSNGSAGVPGGFLEPTGRYKSLGYSVATRSIRHNVSGLHLCIVGNFEEHPVPQSLAPAIAHAVLLLQEKYHIPEEAILFHRDVGATKCPGRHLTKSRLFFWMRTLASQCPPDVAAQQNQAIAAAGCTFRTLPFRAAIVLAASVCFLALAWIGIMHILLFRRQARTMKDKQEHPLLKGLENALEQ